MTKPIIPIVPEQLVADPSKGDGMGCHAGEKQMMAAAKSAGKGEVLQRYAQDYPKGPHDQPQSMCLRLVHSALVCVCVVLQRFCQARHAVSMA